MSSRPVVATVPYLGKSRKVFLNPGQWVSLKFDGNNFYCNQTLGQDFQRLTKEFNIYCRKELSKIIYRTINKLKYRPVQTSLEYTDGKKTFRKPVRFSVYQYLKKIGFSTKLDYKIGHFQKEWGINEVNPKQKKFILYFNQDLIKFDNGPHIEYVVAHELTHVFHRDHGGHFQDTLLKLFPGKKSSERFFDTGIVSRFKISESSNQTKVVFLILIILISWIVVNLLWQFVLNLFSNFVQSSQISGF